MNAALAHFTLDGAPLCTCHCVAYAERMRAAGGPPCSDLTHRQLRRAMRLAVQFPGRIALVFAPCPEGTP